ncbi:MAG: ArnT family glycosyltransferase, partial [Blastocatellia bacterium]
MISRRWVPLCLCLLHCGVLFLPARSHPFGNYATETDFYHYYAPDATRLMAGAFPENPYQGPGYPAALGLIAKTTGQDLFAVGKWLSVVCAVAVGGLLAILFGRLLGWGGGIGAQLLFIFSGEVPQFSINAATDLFFLAICLAALVALPGAAHPRREGTGRIVLAAALSGAAYLTRYNGLFLILTCVAALLWIDPVAAAWRRRLVTVGLYLAICLLVASPWFYANAVHRGSPLYNTNYLNLATQFYPELVAGKTNQDGTRALAERFGSFKDVLMYDPGRVAEVYPRSLGQSLWYSLTGGLVHPLMGVLAWMGIILFLWRRRDAKGLVLLWGAGLYLLLMALNHWETRYYFFIGALYSGMAVLAIQTAGEWLAGKGAGAPWRKWAGRLLPLAA